jgi:hypothetical protein
MAAHPEEVNTLRKLYFETSVRKYGNACLVGKRKCESLCGT